MIPYILFSPIISTLIQVSPQCPLLKNTAVAFQLVFWPLVFPFPNKSYTVPLKFMKILLYIIMSFFYENNSRFLSAYKIKLALFSLFYNHTSSVQLNFLTLVLVTRFFFLSLTSIFMSLLCL